MGSPNLSFASGPNLGLVRIFLKFLIFFLSSFSNCFYLVFRTQGVVINGRIEPNGFHHPTKKIRGDPNLQGIAIFFIIYFFNLSLIIFHQLFLPYILFILFNIYYMNIYYINIYYMNIYYINIYYILKYMHSNSKILYL